MPRALPDDHLLSTDVLRIKRALESVGLSVGVRTPEELIDLYERLNAVEKSEAEAQKASV